MKKILAGSILVCLSSIALADDLAPACTEYFAQIDQVVAASPQGESMKAQYDMAKQQMSSMPKASQEMACKQASDMMKQAMANMPATK